MRTALLFIALCVFVGFALSHGGGERITISGDDTPQPVWIPQPERSHSGGSSGTLVGTVQIYGAGGGGSFPITTTCIYGTAPCVTSHSR